MLGVRIGTYTIHKLLGEGGMGSVYLAEHALLGRRAAIKVLLPAMSANQEIVNRFFNEARATTAITDPGIVQVFDFGYHTDGSAYIVMELLDGESLATRLERVGRLAPRDAFRLIKQVAISLSAAHARGIVHRDLKPDNLYVVGDAAVTGGERMKILDFGIAKLAGDDPGRMKTRTGAVMGTPLFMSPEQCRGVSSIDHRADIYSLGCVLFVAITGRAPFGPNISPMGADHIYSIHSGPNGSFYAAGPVGTSVTGSRFPTVVKMLATGSLDPTFGSSGIATINTPTQSLADEVDLAVQSDGKILVSFSVANGTDPSDRDVAMARLTTTGALDTSFGTGGIAVLDLSSKGGSNITDGPRAIAVGPGNEIYIHAVAKAPGATDHSDFVVAKLAINGSGLVTSWGSNGTRYVDILDQGSPSNASPRAIVVLADGTVIAGGYASFNGTVTPVYFKLDQNGQMDAGFGSNGIVAELVLSIQTEIYGMTLNAAGTKITTSGYGRDSGTSNSFVSLQFDVITGARTMPWGGAGNGAKLVDLSPNGMSSNCRGGILLPGDRLLLFGSTGLGSTSAQDAAFVVLDSSGNVDPYYGVQRFQFVPAEDKNDGFWGGAVSGNKVLLGGWRGTNGIQPTSASNDDAYFITFDLP